MKQIFVELVMFSYKTIRGSSSEVMFRLNTSIFFIQAVANVSFTLHFYDSRCIDGA